MTLPFTRDAFLGVFGQYNQAFWLPAAGLWVLTAWVVVRWFRDHRLGGRLAFGLLALHWGWSAVAYHWLFFRPINPAASAFAALFLAQAICFAWLAGSSRAFVGPAHGARGLLAAALVAYGLAYPLVGLAAGLTVPNLPLFAVPCPTTLITAGVLVASIEVPRWANLLVIVWAAIGSSAAFVLGIRADLALVVAGALLAADTLWPSALGERAVA